MKQDTRMSKIAHRVHKTQITKGMTLIPYPNLHNGEPWQPPASRPRQHVVDVRRDDASNITFIDDQGVQQPASDFYLVEA